MLALYFTYQYNFQKPTVSNASITHMVQSLGYILAHDLIPFLPVIVPHALNCLSSIELYLINREQTSVYLL